MWTTSFDTDWDPYIDDAIELIGVQIWADWLKHTNEWPADYAEEATNAEVKAFLQSRQVPATTFFDALGDVTMLQIWKAQQLAAAFEKVLDDPDAEEALQHPALKPLLEQAAY